MFGNKVLDRLFVRAARGGECFRQWLYPGLPRRYDVNPDVLVIVERGLKAGLSPADIESDVLSKFEADEVARLAGRPGRVE